MATYNVFLDANILISAKFGFCRGPLLHLKEYCDDGIITLFTNDIITREVKHNISKEVDLLAAQAKNAIKDHLELRNSMTAEEFELIKTFLLGSSERLAVAYDAYMQGSVVLSNNEISVVSLFDDYFTPNPPFEGCQNKKSEFPDAVVIMSIKQYVGSAEDRTLHVVTDDNGWHNALKSVSGVYMYSSIQSLLDKVSKDKEVHEGIIEFINENIKQLQQFAENWLYDQEWDSIVDGLDICVECEDVDEVVASQIELAPDCIEYIDDRKGYAVVTLTGSTKVKVCFSYIDHTNESYDKEDHVWYNTEYGDGIVEIEVPIGVSVKVLFPDGIDGDLVLDVPEYDELKNYDLYIVEFVLEEHRFDVRDPFYNVCPDCCERIGPHNDGGNGFCTKCAPNH